MIRESDNAVVIANPSRHRETFDMVQLMPSRWLRHLRASSRQDTRCQALPGRALDGCPEIFGDELERVVRWQAGPDVAAWAGQTVRRL